MRVSVAILAVAAVVALAGCSGAEPNSPVDPENVEADDYLVPLAIFVGVALVGGVALAVGVRRSRRRKGGPGKPAAPESAAEDGPSQERRRRGP